MDGALHFFPTPLMLVLYWTILNGKCRGIAAFTRKTIRPEYFPYGKLSLVSPCMFASM